MYLFTTDAGASQQKRGTYIFLEFYTDHCDIRNQLVTGVKASVAEPEP